MLVMVDIFECTSPCSILYLSVLPTCLKDLSLLTLTAN